MFLPLRLQGNTYLLWSPLRACDHCAPCCRTKLELVRARLLQHYNIIVVNRFDIGRRTSAGPSGHPESCQCSVPALTELHDSNPLAVS